jgi:putative SOS response-associated peptidase YedK
MDEPIAQSFTVLTCYSPITPERNPNTGEWERTFAIITVPSNALVAQIHDRMPAFLKPGSYERWLGLEPDPHDLLITYPPCADDNVAYLQAGEQAGER